MALQAVLGDGSDDGFAGPSGCVLVPYRCEGSSAQESRLLAAVRDGRGVSMADVDRFGSVWDCKTSLFRGVDIPAAGPKLRAFKATVRPVNE